MRALVFGASGSIGRFLLPRWCDAGGSALALTRAVDRPSDAAQLRWQAFDLCSGEDLQQEVDVVFSLGPLDAFVAWWGRSAVRASRLVAFGSTSAASKQDSPVPAERDLAARLDAAEAQLFEVCARREVRATVLRPTLIYGDGTDRNLSRIAQLARRWGLFVLPRGASGRRQPVHADDLAAAACVVARHPGPLQARYDLPGGETLAYRAMVQRVLASLEPPPRLVELPRLPFAAALAIAHRLGRLQDAGSGVLARMGQDLVFDPTPAQRDFGYAPRAFEPTRAMFVASETAGLVHRSRK
ncbi:MAG: nucleoside-diphosphate sugar epimerase [Chiayiivirga sp.]|uniref:NAD-dependent epimerase/dehydratase family protein n=1 Tax=Chiayiivirga sp. TaxID=2041042 RepID=UPI0025C2CC5C|nr:NAD-dependent epimerase/dehydratase family protein [Chiayiivirga sp.]MCI1711682.1 nucleoside-diphosphate sugar epimerase [Chiayiivirga sp.]MCI1729739.1 nucleoside-diphosphate sugar epimerase [Chiayiivirga sp.]